MLNVGVSTVMSPVTHTAEVAVNRASIRESFSAPFQEKGRYRTTVPRAIMARKYEKRNNFSDCRTLLK
jgi:hypothetical protein